MPHSKLNSFLKIFQHLSKPSQFQYECLRSSWHDGKTIEEVYNEAKGLTNLKNSEHQAESRQRDQSSGPLL